MTNDQWFGMTRSESREAFQAQPNIIDDEESGKDAYFNNAVQVSFDSDDKVNYIEIFDEPSFVVTYKNANVFQTPAVDLVEFIQRDAAIEMNDPELGYSYRFPDLELALWRPVMDKHNPKAKLSRLASESGGVAIDDVCPSRINPSALAGSLFQLPGSGSSDNRCSAWGGAAPPGNDTFIGTRFHTRSVGMAPPGQVALQRR